MGEGTIFIDVMNGAETVETFSCLSWFEETWLDAGFDVFNFPGHEVEEMIPSLQTAIDNIVNNIENYRDGEGIGEVLGFLESLLEACFDYKDTGFSVGVRD